MVRDLFDARAADRCHQCGTPVMRVWVDELGLDVPLEVERLSPLSRPPPDAHIFEDHPLHGWHPPWQPRHRGYPLHIGHQCNQRERDKAHDR